MDIVDTLFVNKFDDNKLTLNNAVIKKRVLDKVIELRKQLKKAESVIEFYTDHTHPDYTTKHARKYFKDKEVNSFSDSIEEK